MIDAMELEAAKKLAFGRIMRMASRPTQPGDVEEYERCRRIIMTDATDSAFVDTRPSLARHYGKGDVSQW